MRVEGRGHTRQIFGAQVYTSYMHLKLSLVPTLSTRFDQTGDNGQHFETNLIYHNNPLVLNMEFLDPARCHKVGIKNKIKY